MRHIVRKISLEQFKSRMPGISPSYLGDDKYTFDKNNVSTYPYSNYGMFPKDINISGTCYSYNQLVDIYHKCEERDRLLSRGTCGRQYDSLTEFYQYEQGKSPLTYQECIDREVFYKLYEDEYNVAQTLFPRFIIPLDYRDGWNCIYLYVPDVVRWIEWFKKVNRDDCCQEKEYTERGGETMLSLLQAWLDSVEYEFDACEPFISVPLNITQSIDDLGEFSLMIDEWVPGRDYSKTSSAYSSSTQVLYEDNVYEILGKGYEYDVDNNTYSFSGSLITYTESADTRTYAYNALGQRIDDPNDDKMSINYNINTNNDLGYIVIKGKLIPIEEREYIDIDSKIYPLTYVDFNPYTVIDGITHFGNYEESGYTFTYEGQKYLPQESKAMVEYQHKYYLVDGISVIVNNGVYYKIDGYITYKSEKLLIYNNEIVTMSSSGTINQTRFDFKYTVDGNVCKITEPYQVYKSDTISAYTESKLSSLETITDRVYDNIGNKLPGRYRIINGEYESIQNGVWLEMPYMSKTVAHLSKDDDNLFGDLISKIEFYSESGEIEAFTAKTDMVGVINQWEGTNIKCNITYHMGCVMNSDYEIVNEQSGITYVDTFTLVKKTCSFMVDNTNQYILNYFELQPEYIDYDGEQYLHPQRVRKSRIIFNPQLEDTNTTMNAPIMREEYKLGSSSLENIEANIYIDRGASRSFDYHLKLFEVGSLEGLENYGNSWFRII